jgi:hypothetical protein
MLPTERYDGQRGWMSSNYLALVDNGRRYIGTRAVTALRANRDILDRQLLG